MHNNQIWSTIRIRTDAASEELATKYGEPELARGLRPTQCYNSCHCTNNFKFVYSWPNLSEYRAAQFKLFYKGSWQKGKFTFKNPYLKSSAT